MPFMPRIDDRRFQDIVEKARSLVPFYCPEWNVEDDKGAGVALLKIFAHILEGVIQRLNKAPEKNFIAFLDMLDIQLLPAQPARAPVTFLLAEGTPQDVLVPARTQVSAAATEEHEELIFETERNMLATTAMLQRVYGVNSTTDGVIDDIYDHSPSLEKGERFHIFAGINKQEHSLYIGHEDVFNIIKKAKIYLQISPPNALWGNSSSVIWQYCTEDSDTGEYEWISLSMKQTIDGKIELTTSGEEEIAEREINGIASRWIRCRLRKLPSGMLPTISSISARVKPDEPIPPDLCFYNDVPLDVSDEAAGTTMLPRECVTFWIEKTLNKGATSFEIPSDYQSKFQKNDFIGIKNPEEQLEVRKIASIEDSTARWIEPLKNEYAMTNANGEGDDQAKAHVTLLTAIVAEEADPTVAVESIEPFQEEHRIYLIHGSETETAEIIGKDECKRTLTLCKPGGFANSYIKGDILTLTETYLFGKQPRLFDVLSIASQEAFSKRGATVTLHVSVEHADTSALAPNPKLSWEHWDGKGWRFLSILRDTTDRFLQSGQIEFICPDDIEQTEVNGQENYWIRIRLIAGGYGITEYQEKAEKTDQGDKTWIPVPKYRLPVIQSLAIDYCPEAESLQHCLAYNNLKFTDYTAKSREDNGQGVNPFVRLDDVLPALYLGFDKPLLKGSINIFFSLEESQKQPPKVLWKYWNGSRWTRLDVEDGTDNLTKSGVLALVGPPDLSKSEKFGQDLYWIRAELSEGDPCDLPRVKGVYPNTTWVAQAQTIKGEILGSSDGTANQEFSFTKSPIISEEIWVKEIEKLSEEERKAVIEEIGEDAINEIKDESGRITEIRVKWREVEDFFKSGSRSRHYRINRTLGKIQFGNGEKGMIPPIGRDNVRCSAYQTGGGVLGNVKPLEITSLKTSVPNVDGIVNYEPADGGSSTESIDNILHRGPQMLKHRNRAVTCEDFELLARQASNIVAGARCLPKVNNKGDFAPGWVTIIVVPNSEDNKPIPSLMLKSNVEEYICNNCSNVVSFAAHVNVVEPCYVEMAVDADVIPTSIDLAPIVEGAVLKELKEFFHPLKGGPEKEGWEFGRDVYISDVYAILEGIEGVDHVENVSLKSDREVSADHISVGENCLVCSGEHRINLKFQSGVE